MTTVCLLVLQWEFGIQSYVYISGCFHLPAINSSGEISASFSSIHDLLLNNRDTSIMHSIYTFFFMSSSSFFSTIPFLFHSQLKLPTSPSKQNLVNLATWHTSTKSLDFCLTRANKLTKAQLKLLALFSTPAQEGIPPLSIHSPPTQSATIQLASTSPSTIIAQCRSHG